MNKQEALLISLILLSFTGLWIWYSSGETSLTGQSKNWSGQYVGEEENGTMSRELMITYTGDLNNDELPVTFTVNTESTWIGKEEINWQGTKRLSNRKLSLESKCNDCRIALKSEITVKLEWEGKKEKLVLSK
ncbi:hypothetical protein [Halobacillus trueperi]|uniref:hypothetical protein n=1 Tax=Halobacillus trueperi TaxID=156205 RepID=UPI003736B9A2